MKLNIAQLCLVFTMLGGIFLFLPTLTYAAPLNYSANATIAITTPSTTLTIVAGSAADNLQINDANIAVTLSSTTLGNFIISSPDYDLSITASGSGGNVELSCQDRIVTATLSQSTGSAVYTITPSGNNCSTTGGLGIGGTSGGTYTPPSASVTLSLPASNTTLTGGSTVGISWTSTNGAFIKYRVSYSSDNGNTWTVLTDSAASTSFSWTVPQLSTNQGIIKVEGLDQNGAILASDMSDAVFIVAGLTEAPPLVAPPATTPPATDGTATGSYSSSAALANTPDINTDKGLSAPPAGTVVYCTAGTLIKGSLPAVYYCGSDGKRYVFVNEKAYFSWYSDFSTIVIISDADLALIAIGGNVTYRPGTKMIKVLSDPKVYAVSRGGILRWITTEAIAARLYGANWNQQIDDVPDSFFVNYTIGAAITE